MKVLLMPERSSQVYLRELAATMEAMGVRIRDVPVRPRQRVLVPALGPGLRLVWLRLLGYRILHLHWIPFTNQRLLQLFLLLLRLLGIRLVWSVHNVLPHEPRAQDVEDLRRVYHAARVRIVHTRASRDRLEKEFGLSGTTFHIPLSHLNRSYPPAPPRSAARAELGLREQDFVLLLFGHVRAYKGPDDFVAILRALPPRFRGLVVGRVHPALRPMVDQARQELGERLRVIDEFVPDDRVGTYYAAADAALYPFKEITGTHSVFLAYAFRRPALVRRLPGMDEVVRDGVTGHLCATVPQFVEAVQRLAADPRRAAQMADEGHRWAEEQFGWDRISEGLRLAYETSLERRMPVHDASRPPRR